MLSIAKFIVTALVLVMSFEVIALLLGFGGVNPLPALGFVGILFYVYLGIFWGQRKRYRLMTIPIERVINSERSMIFVPWSQVSGMKLRNVEMEFTAADKTFKGKLETDHKEFVDLMRRKLKERFVSD